MEVHGIVATDLVGAIGVQGKLPWHISSELQHFKNLTIGHPIILGKTTFLGFKKPLPGRLHLILSSTLEATNPDVKVFNTKESLLHFCNLQGFKKIFICGGVSIYQLFKEDIHIWHVSKIMIKVNHADAYLPKDLLNSFILSNEKKFQDEKTQINWSYLQYYKQ